MYDALLDELEDDAPVTQEEVHGLADKSVDELDDEIDTPDLVVQDVDLDIDVDPKAEDLLSVVDEDGESWSDDPVRMYDPGFGYAGSGGSGSRAVLEVRSREVPFILEHGQIVGRLVYEKMLARPDQLYGSGIGSNYQAQGLKLSKHFRA